MQLTSFSGIKGFFEQAIIQDHPPTTLLGVDPNGTFVWCSGGRFTYFYVMFHSRRCLSLPLGLIGNDIKTQGHQVPYSTLYPLLLFLNLHSLYLLHVNLSLPRDYRFHWLFFYEHQALSIHHFGNLKFSLEEAYKARFWLLVISTSLLPSLFLYVCSVPIFL